MSNVVNATWRDPETELVHSVSFDADAKAPFATAACGKVVPTGRLEGMEVVVNCVACMAGLLRRPPA